MSFYIVRKTTTRRMPQSYAGFLRTMWPLGALQFYVSMEFQSLQVVICGECCVGLNVSHPNLKVICDARKLLYLFAMSVQFGKLCSLILLEHFGEIVQKVGSDLFKCQGKPLHLIARSIKLPLRKVTNP